MLAPTSNGPLPGPFVPDRFFLGRTHGHGVLRTASGRLIDTCRIVTDSRWDHTRGALEFDETLTFGSGRSETLNWDYAPDPQGRMVASEPSVEGQVREWTEGSAYRLRFRRYDPSRRTPRFTHDVRLSLMDEDLALRQVRFRLFGFTVATMVAFHRQERD